MKRFALLPALLVAATAQAGVEASGGWIREAPPGAAALAGYVTLANPGVAAQRCTGVTGAEFGAAELHRSVLEDGMSRMLAGQVIELPAGGRVELAPGGLHIMLFRPARALVAGDRTRLTLHCSGGDVPADFTVRRTE